MFKVVIYPERAGFVNKTPYVFDPKERYHALIYLSYHDVSKFIFLKIQIQHDLHYPESEINIVNNAWRRSPSLFSDEYLKEVTDFLKNHIRELVNEKRLERDIFSIQEVMHLGVGRTDRHREALKKELRHWENISESTANDSTDRTRAFGRQMKLLVQGQLNHYDRFVGRAEAPLNVKSPGWRD